MTARQLLFSTCGPDLLRDVFCPALIFTSPNQGVHAMNVQGNSGPECERALGVDDKFLLPSISHNRAFISKLYSPTGKPSSASSILAGWADSFRLRTRLGMPKEKEAETRTMTTSNPSPESSTLCLTLWNAIVTEIRNQT